MFSDSAMEVVTVRPFNCIGTGQSEQFLLPKLVRHFREQKDYIELGNLEVRRDFSDIRDVAEMYRLIITAPEVPRVIQFCSGSTWSIRELIQLLEAITSHCLQVVVNPALVRSNDLLLQQGSRRLLDELGYKMQYSMEDTLRWMCQGEADYLRSSS
jgi:nucleoside-diphosphate-sugar epimerase